MSWTTTTRTGPALVLSGVCAALVLGGCGAEDRTASEGATGAEATSTASTAPEGTPESAAPGALPEALQRTWLLDVPRDRLVQNLRRHGYAKWADRFVRSEDLAPQVRMAMTLSEDYFSISWETPDGVWDEGWFGAADVEAGVLTIHDDYYEDVSDSFDFALDGEELELSFRETTADKVRGIPSEVYSRAYFGQPWRQGDCDPSDLSAC